jgi:hypothetical protein
MDLVRNARALTERFGGWPSFHDAEVHSLHLERAGPHGPSLSAVIHVFEMTSEVAASGHYVLKNHTLVTFRFDDVAIEYLDGFNEQNVLAALHLTPIEESQLDPPTFPNSRLQVVLESSYGLDAGFECATATIVEARPYSVH